VQWQFSDRHLFNGVAVDWNAIKIPPADYLALVSGITSTPPGAPMTSAFGPTEDNELLNLYTAMFFGGPSCGHPVPDPLVTTDARAKGNSLFDLLQHIRGHVDTLAAGGVDLDALAAKVAPLVAGPVADLKASIDALTAKLDAAGHALES
jgi:hypothetical protein